MSKKGHAHCPATAQHRVDVPVLKDLLLASQVWLHIKNPDVKSALLTKQKSLEVGVWGQHLVKVISMCNKMRAGCQKSLSAVCRCLTVLKHTVK